nr:MAG TPA: hypothetical protein [Caudoviricetes sp.]
MHIFFRQCLHRVEVSLCKPLLQTQSNNVLGTPFDIIVLQPDLF